MTLSEVKKNPQVLEFIKETEKTLAALSYTDHGLRHANLVADRARNIAKEIGLSKNNQELAAITGFCHDMGNFISRGHHNYFGALLFHQVFNNDFEPKEMAIIMQAISNHDKSQEDMSFANPVSAVVVLADKSDVHRSRVTAQKMEEIKADIHDRVNYATKECRLKIDKTKKRITLTLKIDTNFVPIVEYFEVFTDRMVFCRLAAEYLGYNFGLVINNFRLL
ncbi:HD domain-containing protein [Patescibacteria group bacterium]|nr:HD domain-containing protein [Patescibacteria group bacterium]